jgi:hypothetical protein
MEFKLMENDDKREAGKIGGTRRAEVLPAARRSQIARQAATSRWDKELPQADYEGEFILGGYPIACAVLPTRTRIITQAAFLRALARSRSPKAGTGVLSTVDDLPFFLQAEALKPFISEDLAMSTSPIFYRSKSGGRGVGYDARLLPQVAEVYLRFRDEMLRQGKAIPSRYEKMIRAADLLMRGLANVGIIALVDEATGFQRDRAADALAEILEKFIAKELRPWIRTFPDEYYVGLFRLRGLDFPKDSVKRPQYFGHLTNDIIYSRLAPKVLDELKNATPRTPDGRHKQHLHRRLTDDFGHPRLREHLAAVVTVMQLSDDYEEFVRKLDKVKPRFGETLPLPLDMPRTGL